MACSPGHTARTVPEHFGAIWSRMFLQLPHHHRVVSNAWSRQDIRLGQAARVSVPAPGAPFGSHIPFCGLPFWPGLCCIPVQLHQFGRNSLLGGRSSPPWKVEIYIQALHLLNCRWQVSSRSSNWSVHWASPSFTTVFPPGMSLPSRTGHKQFHPGVQNTAGNVWLSSC